MRALCRTFALLAVQLGEANKKRALRDAQSSFFLLSSSAEDEPEAAM